MINKYGIVYSEYDVKMRKPKNKFDIFWSVVKWVIILIAIGTFLVIVSD